MDKILIDKGVPIPPATSGRYAISRYPFDRLEVGDSFVAMKVGEGKRNTVASYMSAAQKRYGYKFSMRTVTEDGVAIIRIWRIA